MKISEKQILKLISHAETLTLIFINRGQNEAGTLVGKLISQIQEQQSDELREVE